MGRQNKYVTLSSLTITTHHATTASNRRSNCHRIEYSAWDHCPPPPTKVLAVDNFDFRIETYKFVQTKIVPTSVLPTIASRQVGGLKS